MFCGTLLTIKVESLLLAGFLSLAQRKGGVGKSVRRDFNLNYEEERRILSRKAGKQKKRELHNMECNTIFELQLSSVLIFCET